MLSPQEQKFAQEALDRVFDKLSKHAKPNAEKDYNLVSLTLKAAVTKKEETK